MNEYGKRRANFRSMALMSLAMLCGMASNALPLLTGGGLNPVRATLLTLFTILFIDFLTLAIKNRPRNSNRTT